jgi:hypothetical protein
MEFIGRNDLLTSFEFEGVVQPVEFIETTKEVSPGAECDVYKFVGDDTKDLGIIRIEPGCKTPLQRVLNGDKTIEGYVSGSGRLTVRRSNNIITIVDLTGEPTDHLSIEVKVGDTMQWKASPNSKLVAYEVCIPPYADGRFENLP